MWSPAPWAAPSGCLRSWQMPSAALKRPKATFQACGLPVLVASALLHPLAAQQAASAILACRHAALATVS